MGYAVFTAEDGAVTAWAKVDAFALRGGAVIAAILVGGEGRDRKLGVLPVAMDPPPAGSLTRLRFARLGATRSGAPKLIPADRADHDDHAIVVFRSGFGYRGTNAHTGHWLGWADDGRPQGYAPLPGRVLARGVHAEDPASWGEQLVLLLPRGAEVWVKRGGRLYGAPALHIYAFDGAQLTVRAVKKWP